MTFDKFSDMIFPVTKKGSFFCCADITTVFCMTMNFRRLTPAALF